MRVSRNGHRHSLVRRPPCFVLSYLDALNRWKHKNGRSSAARPRATLAHRHPSSATALAMPAEERVSARRWHVPPFGPRAAHASPTGPSSPELRPDTRETSSPDIPRNHGPHEATRSDPGASPAEGTGQRAGGRDVTGADAASPDRGKRSRIRSAPSMVFASSEAPVLQRDAE
jgi:hypothetical protein